MTTFTWIVNQMDCYPTLDGHDDVVKTVYWRVRGEDGSYTAATYGSCGLPGPGTDFILYQDLTEADVLGWIWANGISKTEQEAAVQSQIDALINPPVVTLALPWE